MTQNFGINEDNIPQLEDLSNFLKGMSYLKTLKMKLKLILMILCFKIAQDLR